MHRKLVAFDGVLTVLESNLEAKQHCQPMAFAIFSDFADDA